jgi:hypothetical protein
MSYEPISGRKKRLSIARSSRSAISFQCGETTTVTVRVTWNRRLKSTSKIIALKRWNVSSAQIQTVEYSRAHRGILRVSGETIPSTTTPRVLPTCALKG